MLKRTLAVAAILALTASAAYAQYGGGMGGGGGGGGGGGRHGGGRKSQAPPPDSSAPASSPAPPTHLTPLNKVEIVGVITSIDQKNQRITIHYQEVDALNWPEGTTPFVVEKPQLMDGATVGEKVRFKIESQQISDLEPFAPPKPGS